MDGRGVPLSIIVTAANVNDGKRIDAVLSAIMVKRKTTPICRSKHLCADAGYRSVEALQIIDSHGYIPHVVDRRQEAAAKRRQPWQKARRWVVEVCHSWLTLPRFHVHQKVGNVLMKEERDEQEGVGSEPAIHGRVQG